MAAPVVAASTNNVGGGASTSAVGNRPAGTTNGDYLVAFVYNQRSSGATVTAIPAGWSAAIYDDTASSSRVSVYVKTASGEPATWTWTLSAAANWTVNVARVTGQDAVTPLSTSAGQINALSTNIVAPSLAIPSIDNLLICSFSRDGSGGTAITLPGSMTSIANGAIGTTNRQCAIAYQTLVSSGATGTRTATSIGAVNAGFSMAIQAVAIVGARQRMLYRYATAM